MGRVAIVFGVLLIGLGVAGFIPSKAMTALIPAWFGLAMAICGVLALRESLRKHAMHAAAMVGLLGAVGAGAMGIPKLITLLSGGEVARPIAVYSQCAMFVLCVVFVVLCVRSFVAARLARKI
ncbi:MAG: hypothetical protein K1X53_03275 [Candidatus Sumerlaeaceae bacterium]|nr:hypothetical protein [Candidatus Sumerlaeaceae bacterium]